MEIKSSRMEGVQRMEEMKNKHMLSESAEKRSDARSRFTWEDNIKTDL
jgi:hypothetical protein